MMGRLGQTVQVVQLERVKITKGEQDNKVWWDQGFGAGVLGWSRSTVHLIRQTFTQIE